MFRKSREERELARQDREWRRLVRQMASGGEGPAGGQERMRAYLESLREAGPAEAPGAAPPGQESRAA